MLRLVLIPILAGFIGTWGITLFLWGIDKAGWANADMVRAIGSLFTKKYENALRVGIIVHFTAGIIISTIYLHLFSLLNPPGLISTIFFGALLGFAHGFFFSFILVIYAEHHPLEKFKDADFHVAIAHLLGHVIYGMLIGATFAVLRVMGVDVSPGITF